MAMVLSLERKSTGDIVKVPIPKGSTLDIVSNHYLSKRFGLCDTEFVEKIMSAVDGNEIPHVEDDGVKKWMLNAHHHYFVMVTSESSLREQLDNKGKGKVVDISSSSSGKTNSLLLTERESLREVRSTIQKRTYRISALDRFLNISGTSELSSFLKKRTWHVQHVNSLPPSYNGDVVFELPPVEGYMGRNHFFKGMDREMDCYSWTRIIRTSAGITPKKQFIVGKVRCTGSLQCRNDFCVYYHDKNVRNDFSWIGKSRVTSIHVAGKTVPEGGVQCGFCMKPPFCVDDCPAKMFFIYPRLDVGGEMWTHMSRLAIHMGHHFHSTRKIFSPDSIEKVQGILESECAANPGATPSRIKNVTAGKLLGYLHPETAADLFEEEEREIWESLQVISTPAKFAQVLRSVRDMRPDGCELDCIIRMQKNIRFPFIQRFLYPGQSHESERCHIFKMSVKGSGSGVDLLKRMVVGGTLEGSWVMFDVMHRCTKGWKTLSAHVYDHNYRALCIIFTCELLVEDSLALEKAWRLMIEVAKENGVENFRIQGFMADNAEAGWIAVRKVFFGGFADPERERSDAFHFRQSFHRHSMEGIKENKREEHFLLWEKLRKATSYVQAYRISEDI